MSNQQAYFDKTCSTIRFHLDDVVNTSPRDQRSIADFVAHVSATALRVTEATVPHVHASVERVIKRLAIDKSPEVYVQNNAESNAYALAPGSHDRLVVVVNSSLVQLLAERELDFVIGHELGHFGMRHGGTPEDSRSEGSEFAFLRRQSVSRCQEVSADRIGLLGARSINVAANVIMKMASGLGEGIRLDVASFIQQLDRSPDEMSRDWELAMTHPSLPLRLWALIQFSHSREYNELSDKGTFGDDLSKIEPVIVERFNALGDGRLSTYEEECHSTAVMWSGLMMIMDDNLIEQSEQEALAELVGDSHAKKAIQFVREHGKAAAKRKCHAAVADLLKASETIRQKYIGTVTRFGEIVDVNASDIVELDLLKQAKDL